MKGPTKLERLMQKTGQNAPSETHEPKRKRALSAAEKNEEDEIQWLEYQLYGKKKAAPQEGDDIDCM